ncbi:MAG: mechanosensitive ion channel family protein [Desulfurococcales archaeon]|nr:mechanosensitive ion channel family protein [Desulfurococcales archaeon]
MAEDLLSGLADAIKGSVENLVVAILVFTAGLIVAYFVRGLMRRSLKPKLPPHIYRPLELLVFYSLLAVSGIAALYPFGINLSGLLIAGGFAGIVVGLAAQNTLGNLVSGVMLLIEQPLRIGDPVNVAGISGVVVGINIFSTRIRTWDGPIVRIPNNTVFNEIITNYVRMRARRVEIAIGVHYDTDIDKAIETVKRLMESHPLCLVNPSPEAFVDQYADSAIVIKMRCWAPPQAWFATKIELQTRLKKALDEAGIKIPYPQLDLHIIDQEEDLRVRMEKGLE